MTKGNKAWINLENGSDLASEQVDDLKGVFHDADGQQFLAVVASVHHHGVSDALHNGTLSLTETLGCVSAAGMGEVFGIFLLHGNVILLKERHTLICLMYSLQETWSKQWQKIFMPSVSVIVKMSTFRLWYFCCEIFKDFLYSKLRITFILLLRFQHIRDWNHLDLLDSYITFVKIILKILNICTSLTPLMYYKALHCFDHNAF